jgi:hypothetical protein
MNRAIGGPEWNCCEMSGLKDLSRTPGWWKVSRVVGFGHRRRRIDRKRIIIVTSERGK